MEATQICFDIAQDYAVIATGIVTTIVTVCSVLANIVKSDGVLGKAINYGAVNIKTKK